MKTVNSISGGKTSAYLTVHHPADYDLFALVCNDDPNCAHPDPYVMQFANDKLNKYCAHYGEFIGTPEHYKTLRVVMDLEQLTGREIIWLRDYSFDHYIEYKRALPNQNTRWCTTLMKMKPIFEFCYLRLGKVEMRIGFRHDEQERAERLSTTFEFPKWCNTYGQKRQAWDSVEWRVGSFPLIETGVTHLDVYRYWLVRNLDFPIDSNCQMCFWKHEMQLRKNFEDAPNVMNWAKQKEKQTKNRFRHAMKMSEIERIAIQAEFAFGGGSGCQADGFCTD